MGQSVKSRRRRPLVLTRSLNLSIFPTACGWCGLVGADGVVEAVIVGHASADNVRRAAGRKASAATGGASCDSECDWHPQLRQRLEQYCSGAPVEFDDIRLALPAGTPFQRRILALTRKIAYGKTATYGDLAAKAGYSRAARAVGSVMASNRFPLLIPCHRVVASGGGWGGYTCPQGVDLKIRLLQMESEVQSAKSALRAPSRAGARRARTTSVVR
ncbi:MAG: methylated-DNA--[protein]-cysteine S-methyltransferase [Planctomycetaceae bacterium]